VAGRARHADDRRAQTASTRFVNWGWDYFGKTRGPQVLDRSDAGPIDWEEDAAPEPLSAAR
jgi:hypothetical protein